MKTNRHTTRVIALLVTMSLFLACRDRARPYPDAHMPTPCEQARLHFHRHRIAPVGLELDVLDGVDVLDQGVAIAPGNFPAPPTEREGWIAQSTPDVTLALRYGADATLPVWRGATVQGNGPILFEPEVTTSICHRPARRQQFTDPGFVQSFDNAARADGATAAPEHGSGPHPATLHVAISFEHRGMPALATWTGPTGNIAQLRCVEERFLRGLRCD